MAGETAGVTPAPTPLLDDAPCPGCGFDPAHWSERDAATSLRVFGHLWDDLVEGLAAADVDAVAPLRVTGPLRPDAADRLRAVHAAWHRLDAAGRLLAERGALGGPAAGRVTQVSTSRGGVPKRAVDGSVEVGYAGLAGDRQDDREHHGRPMQAVCLWSAEVIAALRAEGHPVTAGAAGENLTVTGLDWAGLRPGARLAVGAGERPLLLALTGWAVPCSKNAPWFRDGDFRRMAHDRHPGWSRAYARVLRPGPVRAGDAVRLLP